MGGKKFILIYSCILILFNCKSENKEIELSGPQENVYPTQKQNSSIVHTPKGMVWVESKTFTQGAKEADGLALIRETPARQVHIDGFFIDITEVTNKQFKSFVDKTNYVTVAERPLDWEIIKKDLSHDAVKPHDSILQPGSLVFNKNINHFLGMNNHTQWWTWKVGANWKHPKGPGSSIKDKDDYPVVHITLEDALAYCKWANRRLPTEAEWESAAQGTATNYIFTWGNSYSSLSSNANTWQGEFPLKNECIDGFESVSPVKCFNPNTIGLYDMLGNVWELTNDIFDVNHYKKAKINGILNNPQGPSELLNSNVNHQKRYVIKGGSYLCHVSYCASFRISARMGMEIDSGSDHIGFRTVVTKKMLQNKF